MANTTPISTLPYPALTSPPNVPSDMQALATALDSITVPRFASTVARDNAITAPQHGQVCVTTDVTHPRQWIYDSTLARWLMQTVFRRSITSPTTTTNTSPVPVTSTQIWLESGGSYVFDMSIVANGGSANGVTIGWTAPSGSHTWTYQGIRERAAATAFVAFDASGGFNTTASPIAITTLDNGAATCCMRISGTIAPASSGYWTIYFTQAISSGVTTTLYSASWWSVTQI